LWIGDGESSPHGHLLASRANEPLHSTTTPGRPDLVLPKHHTVIFVHGCFWHGHENCPHFRLPKSRCAWWTAKIHGNQARDLRNETALLTQGWHVVTIWECALKTQGAREWLEKKIPRLLGA
jgi:DNA mismatch endonuclease (patch repair protein)